MITIFVTFGIVAVRCIFSQTASDCELFSVKQLVIPLATAETIFEVGILRILRKRKDD